mgnify:CR=1 FL=1
MRKIIVLILFSGMMFLAVSCGDDAGEQPYQPNMSNFFSNYLSVICDSAASCKSGLVSSETRLNCPDIILHYPFPFPALKRGENIIFMQKFEMLDSAEKAGWVKVDME